MVRPLVQPSDPLDHRDKARLRAAAYRAVRVLPGPLGELVQRELSTWEEFGYRFGGGSLIDRVVRFVESQPEPGRDSAA